MKAEFDKINTKIDRIEEFMKENIMIAVQNVKY